MILYMCCTCMFNLHITEKPEMHPAQVQTRKRKTVDEEHQEKKSRRQATPTPRTPVTVTPTPRTPVTVTPTPTTPVTVTPHSTHTTATTDSATSTSTCSHLKIKEHPAIITKGDWVLVQVPKRAHAEEKEKLWLATVTEVKKNKTCIIYWAVKTNTGNWCTINTNSWKGRTTQQQIIAKIHGTKADSLEITLTDAIEEQLYEIQNNYI